MDCLISGMIEYKIINTKEKKYYLEINGELLKDAFYENNQYWSISNTSSKKLAHIKIEEFLPFIHIRLLNFFKWENFNTQVYIIKSYDKNSKPNDLIHIELYFHPILIEWKEKYSFNEFFELFNSFWRKNDSNPGLNYENVEDVSFWLTFKIKITNKTIEEILYSIETELNNTYKKTFANLKNDNELTYWFEFPEEIKVSCKQYLDYFAQFLQDIGSDITSNLTEKAGKILFSVTPTNDIQALDKIREALAIYLNLPASPIVYDESFAAMRLQQQIENLQHSQKMAVSEIRIKQRELQLSQNVIESRDKIINQKDSIIEQQNKVIEKISSKSIMMDSLENKEEFVKVFEGFEVGESKLLKEQLGIKFNPVISLKTLGDKYYEKMKR